MPARIAFLFLVLFGLIAGCSTTPPTEKAKLDTVSVPGSLALDEGLARLATDISATVNEPYVVAVTDFPDIAGEVTLVSKHISEGLITPLVSTGRFNVIERHLLEQILKEQSLTMTGMIDEESAREIGKILGVDALVSGTYADFGEVCRINARLISTETGEIVTVAKVNVLKSSFGGAAGALAGGPRGNDDVYGGSKNPEAQKGLILTEEALSRMEITKGNWFLDQDRLSNGQVGNVLRQDELSNGNGISFGNPDLLDYVFEFDIKVNKAVSLPMVHIIVRNQEPGIHYDWVFGEPYQTYVHTVSTDRFYFQSGGSRVKLHGQGGELPIGEWHHIKIKCQGGSITCFYDGKVLHQIAHDGAFKGRVGFVTGQTDVSFREIVIEEL